MKSSTSAAKPARTRAGKQLGRIGSAKARSQPPPKTPPYRANRYGIQNHLGDVWTPETFETPDRAQKYLDQQRKVYGGLTKKHKVVPVRVTVSIRPTHSKPA